MKASTWLPDVSFIFVSFVQNFSLMTTAGTYAIARILSFYRERFQEIKYPPNYLGEKVKTFLKKKKLKRAAFIDKKKSNFSIEGKF